MPRWCSGFRKRAGAIRWRCASSSAAAPARCPKRSALERALLDPLAEIGHSIDTSGLHPNLLRHWVRQFVDSPHANLTLSFESFAFKDGIPVAADLVFDVRNLPNPHYDPELRPLTGRDEAVAAFLVAAPQVREMINDIAAIHRKMAAELCGRAPALRDGRHRLHRRTASIGVRRRRACAPLPAARSGAWSGIAASNRSNPEKTKRACRLKR